MAAKSFLRRVSGKLTEILGTIVSTGAANDGDIVALDSTGKLDVSVLPVGLGPEVALVPASESLAAGDLVNFWTDAGVIKARKADGATTGKQADGFVLSAFAPAATATVYLPSNINTSVAGLTPGTEYFLSATTPGGLSATPPAGAGKTSQVVGKALSATSLGFVPEAPIVTAA